MEKTSHLVIAALTVVLGLTVLIGLPSYVYYKFDQQKIAAGLVRCYAVGTSIPQWVDKSNCANVAK